MLRRVPHRARQIVDPQALERPRGDGVDVQIAQLGERLSSPHEIRDRGEALRARGHDHEHHPRRDDQRRGWQRRPRGQVDRRHEQERDRDGVQLEACCTPNPPWRASVAGTRKYVQ